MVLFRQQGSTNTGETIAMGLAKAIEYNCDIVISSSSGQTAIELIRQAQERVFSNKIVVVRTVGSPASQGLPQMCNDRKTALEQHGAVVVTAAHALSAGERGIRARMGGGFYPLELMAHTLRTMGEGTKVCFECAVMALDANAIPYGRPIVAMGGTGRGVDTALVITPSFSASILDTRIHEFICKPGL